MPAVGVRKVGCAGTLSSQVLARRAGQGGTTRALRFYENTDNVVVSSLNPLLSLTAFTIEAWVFLTAIELVNSQFILRFRNGNVGMDFRIDASTNKPNLVVGNGTTSTFSAGLAVPIGQWVHLAGSYDASNVRTFTGGILGATSALAAANTGNPGISLDIGNSFSGSTSALHGLMSNLRFSSVARYTANFSVPDRPFVPDSFTLGLWPLGEGGGVKCFDISGNALHGTFATTATVQLPTWAPGYF